jgi:hypothetical protein
MREWIDLFLIPLTLALSHPGEGIFGHRSLVKVLKAPAIVSNPRSSDP